MKTGSQKRQHARRIKKTKTNQHRADVALPRHPALAQADALFPLTVGFDIVRCID